MDTPPASPSSSDRLPGWLAEALDVLVARRRVVVATAVGILLVGAIVALVAPSILPPSAVVGAAVGIAAALLATALALAMDASDLVVRGARHVRAAGGSVDVVVGRQHDDVGPLLAAVSRHASGGRIRIALSAASRTAGVPGVRAAALAEAIARTGRKVLLTDLSRGGTPAAGLSDVISGGRSLAEVVRFEHELYLARLAVGSDPDAAIGGFAGWVRGLPSDLEVLVAALPPLAENGVLAAAGAMDVTLVLVEVDRTERVDLIASLDAVDASGLTSELVLVDPSRAVGPAAAKAPATAPPAPDEDVDRDDATVDEPVPASSTTDVEDVVEPDAPVAPPEDEDPDLVVLDDEGPSLDDILEGDPVVDEPAVDAPEADEPRDDGTEPSDDTDEPRWGDDGTASGGEIAAMLGATGLAAGGATSAGSDETAEITLPDAGRDETDDEPEVDTAPDPEPTDAEPAPEPAVESVADEPVADEPAPEPVDPPEPGDAPEPVTEEPAPRPEPVPLGSDPAALEVARTSAALHQLAQQIWDREG